MSTPIIVLEFPHNLLGASGKRCIMVTIGIPNQPWDLYGFVQRTYCIATAGGRLAALHEELARRGHGHRSRVGHRHWLGLERGPASVERRSPRSPSWVDHRFLGAEPSQPMDFGKFGIHLEWTYSDLILGEYYTTQHRLRVNITQHHNTGSTYTSAIWRKALRRQKDIAIYIIYIHLIGRVCWSIQCFLASDHCGLDKNWSSIIRWNHVIDS